MELDSENVFIIGIIIAGSSINVTYTQFDRNPLRITMEDKLKEYEEQVKQDYRWNFIVNAADFALYTLALSFASILTILPAFVSKFTNSNVVIGMIPAINVIGWLMPQLAAAKYVEKFDKKKRLVVVIGVWERLPWLLVALAIILLRNSKSFWILMAFFVSYAIFCFAGGINTPPWLDMIGKIIPEKKRGQFFGISNLIGNGTGVGGALIAGYFLENLAFPWNFAICFVCAFIAMSISLGFVAATRETAYPVVKEKSSLNDYLRQLTIIGKTNHNYLFFLIAAVFISFSSMASGFFTVHAISKLNLTGEDIGRLTAITLLFQTISNPLWGQWGDKKGHKNVMAVGAVGMILSAIIAAFAKSTMGFYAVFAIIGASISADTISRLSIVLEFSPPEERPTYIGLTNTIRAPFSAIAPLLGGLLSDRFQRSFVFLLTAIIITVGLFFLIVFVKEPRSQREQKD